VIEGLTERFDIALGLSLLMCMTVLSVEATPLGALGDSYGPQVISL
jgi:hypothetical protein